MFLNEQKIACVRLKEKKELIKFFPSSNFPRSKEVKFWIVLLAWQEWIRHEFLGSPSRRRLQTSC